MLQANAEKILFIVLPIESGSNKILRSMNRRYTSEEVYSCLSDFYKKVPGVKIETHIIIGFPGETDEDFCETKRLVQVFLFLAWLFLD